MVALDSFARDALDTGSRDRVAAKVRTLADFDRFLGETPLTLAGAEQLEAFLAERAALGRHPNTLRKERTMIRSFFTWAWRHGHTDADTVLSIQSVPPPAQSSPTARPQPYTAREMRELRALLDARWPKLEPAEAQRWVARWTEGRSPYSRVRAHAIRLQLEAMIALALRCGLRRGEMFRLALDDCHPDNAYVVVCNNDGTTREVPFTVAARDTARVDRVRAQVAPDHNRVWLNLWSRNTVRDPMTSDAFARTLVTYVGQGWTLRRLRDTCAAELVRAGLPLWHVQTFMGHRLVRDMIPYLHAVDRTDVHRATGRVEGRLPILAVA